MPVSPSRTGTAGLGSLLGGAFSSHPCVTAGAGRSASADRMAARILATYAVRTFPEIRHAKSI
jgi:hypothetical protein